MMTGAAMNFIEQINEYVERLKNALSRFNKEEMNKFAELLLDTYLKDENIFIFGNGGSASTASHFATDINKGVSYGLEKRFKVIPLTDNLATITAYANDLSYEDIFVEQLKNFLRDGDLVIGISSSGNSKNVLKAIEYANSRGNITVGITGFDGGSLRKVATYSVNANVNDIQISEDIHMVLTHLAIKITRKVLTGREE